MSCKRKKSNKILAVLIMTILSACIFAACGKPKQLFPGKYELNIYTQEDDGRTIRDQKIVEVYENAGVENTWYITFSEASFHSANGGMDAVVYQTMANSVIVPKEEGGSLSFYTNPSGFADTLIYVELEQKDEETLSFRYSVAGDANETEYAELIKQKDYADEPVEYPQDVNCIAGEKIQVSQAALQGMQEILPMEDTLQKTNALPEGTAAHTGLGYPWLILGVPVWEHDVVAQVGTVETKEDVLPGAAEGIWSVVSVGGVDYHYGCYDHAPDEWDLFSYVITGEELVLGNGLYTGMTEEEMLHVCPGLVKIEFTDDRSLWQFNGGCYATDFTDSYNYFYAAEILCGCEGTENEHVPLELALLIKEGKVAGITVFSPTAG